MRRHTTFLLQAVVFTGIAVLLSACGDSPDPTPVAREPVPTVAAPAAVTVAWNANTTVGQVVADQPETARVFSLVGIDYCCGGETPLGEAAAAQSIDVAKLLSALTSIGPKGTTPVRDWQRAPLPDLMDHIIATHHVWLRRELPRIRELVDTVHDVHGESHAELAEVRAQFHALEKAIGPHLEEEERHAFPAVKALVAGEPGDDVKSLLTAMRTDHDEVGAALHRINELTKDFRVPDDACTLYREMLAGLEALEDDLHQHVHLENNVLLPRALDLLEDA